MNHSVLYIPSVFRDRHSKDAAEKPLLTFEKYDFKWPLLFLLCLSLTGLHVYPAILGCLAILLKAFREDRYQFAIMAFFLFGGYSIMPINIFPVKFTDVAFLSGIVLAVLLRKPPLLKRMLVLYLLFVAVLLWVAHQSWESMRVQFIVLRFYFSFIVVFIYLATFANRSFDLRRMVHTLMAFLVLVCGYYIADGIIFKTHFFIPGAVWSDPATITALSAHPFSLTPARVYPHALVFIPFALIPAMRMYRIPAWVWVMVALSALTTFTFTYITALVVTCLLFQGSLRRLLKISIIALLGFAAAYGIDSILPMHENEYGMRNSTLRIRSTIDQFVALSEAMDDEDIAEFGSGRMAQAIPKMELVSLYHKEMTGLGFLHQDYSNNTRFIVNNEYYTDVTQSEEVATGIEVIPLQIYISGGWIGLIAMNVFLFGLWFIVRKLTYSYIYAASLVFVLIMGIGGFASPTTFPGMQILAFAFAMVVLANRSILPGFSEEDSSIK